MKQTPMEIFGEYQVGCNYKNSLGNRGLYEQSRINERFFIGDQWYGAKCGNERPLVRHNVIKRIGDYKMSQILSNAFNITYSADGIPSADYNEEEYKDISLLKDSSADEKEINYVMSAFGNYYNVASERVGLSTLHEKVLRRAFISGSAVLYTYWDSTVKTGFYVDDAKKTELKGDICCEVLDINDIVFADPYIEDVQKQPYIIISSRKDKESVLREARLNGADITTLRQIEEDAQDGKLTVLTKLYKEYKAGTGYIIKSVKVTENAIVRREFDTSLRLYPLALFSWERKNNCIYGESEITYLIPNQIAINRMITANVWSAMTTGMPIMVVNGDTVTDKISNDPGQIIKVFGSNEDVAGAVKYVSPPSFTKDFDNSINTLIENTLTQSGANEVALGDSKAENATALITMRDSALMPLQMIKNRFYVFCEDIARIWADFWLTHYGKRMLELKDSKGRRYIPFDAERYASLVVGAKVDVSSATVYNEREKAEMLVTLFEKGVINRAELIERLPKGLLSKSEDLLKENEKENE
ncbi:MAG: hypothetical protein E7560_01865 [Ruminococcaceae bacterium]|nr:hypothetical protein [Oscillospiraceae bacterium]